MQYDKPKHLALPVSNNITFSHSFSEESQIM